MIPSAQPPVFHFPEYCPGRHLIRMRPSILMRNRRKYNRPQRIRLQGGSTKFVQSTDEMSAALAQFRNRRDYEKIQ